MNVPEIDEVKNNLGELKKKGLIKDWELPYENLLTRRSAAIFFVNPVNEDSEPKIWEGLNQFDHFFYRENIEKDLSKMSFRVTFNPDEKSELE